MKLCVALAVALVAFAFPAIAAPTLSAQPYPAGPGKPTSASVTVNGLAQINCQLQADATGAVTPTCDLASLASGTYTLVLVVTNAYNCTTVQGGASATCTGGGTASSAPFSFTWAAPQLVKPVVQFRP